MNPIKIDITSDGLAFAVDAIAEFSRVITDEDGGALPMVFVRRDDGKQTGIVVTAGTGEPAPVTEADVATGRDLLRQLRERTDFSGRAVLVYDSVLRIEDTRTSALIAEIIEGRTRHVLAQRYTCSGSRFVPVGRTIYMAGNASDADA